MKCKIQLLDDDGITVLHEFRGDAMDGVQHLWPPGSGPIVGHRILRSFRYVPHVTKMPRWPEETPDAQE